MKQCIALAGVVCLALSGCAQTGVLTGKSGRPAHVTRSMSAPRPQSQRLGASPGASSVELANYNQYDPMYDPMGGPMRGCDCCDGACAVDGYCDDVCCGDGCTGGCCNGKSAGQRWNDACNCMRDGYGRWDRRATCLAEGMASGFCPCPHSGGYPEQARFMPGPPTGQVAYPYYTVRGPRDFLQDNPPSIGPY